jgi:hypothetical protein
LLLSNDAYSILASLGITKGNSKQHKNVKMSVVAAAAVVE